MVKRITIHQKIKGNEDIKYNKKKKKESTDKDK